MKLREEEKKDDSKKSYTEKKKKIDDVTKSLEKNKQKVKEVNNEEKKSKSLFDGIGKSSKKAFENIVSGGKKSNKMFATLASRTKGILLSLLIFNNVTKAWNAMINGMQEGFRNLALYSDEYNKSVSELKSANTQMKNSFATTFGPIVQMAIPNLISLINHVTEATNKVAQFTAVLSGKDTWTKAIKVQEDYAESLKGTASAANKALASFDTLEVLNKSASGAGQATAPEDMFEEVPIENAGVANLAKKFKDLINEDDWEGIGTLIGDKLQDSLENIQWDNVYQRADNFGTGLAGFLNGTISSDTFGAVGTTVANSLNTAVLGALAFGKEFDFYDFGVSLATGLNNFFEDFDESQLADALNVWVDGLKETIAGFLDTISWKDVIDATTTFLGDLELDTIGVILAGITIKKFGVIKIASGAWNLFGKNLSSKITYLFKTSGGFNISSLPITLSNLAISIGNFAWMNPGIIGEIGLWIEQQLIGTPLDTNTWTGKAKDINDAVNDLLDEINQSITDWFDRIGSEYDFTLDIGWDWTLDFFETSERFFNDMDDAFQEKDWARLGEDILQGVLHGITGAAAFVLEPIIDVGEWIWDAFCQVFGIHSPADEMKQIGEYIMQGVIEGLMGEKGSFLENLQTWYEEDVKPWFTAEKWLGLAQGIKDGVSGKWGETVEEWRTNISNWFSEDAKPWFSKEKWNENTDGMKDGISSKWSDTVTEWKSNISKWFSEDVKPWFTKEKWKELGTNMKTGIYNGFHGIVAGVVGVVNGMITATENMINYVIQKINSFIQAAVDQFNKIPGVDLAIGKLNTVTFQRVPMPDVPALADGTVIRGGNPFLAWLGDQPHGQTNVETPVSTIEDAVARGIAASGGTGGPLTVNLVYDGETFARLSMDNWMQEATRRGFNIDILGGNA